MTSKKSIGVVALVILLTGFGLASTFSARSNDRERAKNIIANIEKQSRGKRLVSYVKALKRETLTPYARFMLIHAFAKHAVYVSSLYGQSKVGIDAHAWISLLTEGWKAEPKNRDIVIALTQILINHGKYEEALEVIIPFHNENPQNHDAAAWHAWALKKTRSAGISFAAGKKDIPNVDIHFCVITKNPQAHSKANLQRFHKEIEILNKYFRTLKGCAIVHFRFKSASFYDEVKDLNCKFVALGDSQTPYDTNRYARVFNQCTHEKVRDRHAINFYVYDSYAQVVGYKDTTCHGKRNSNRPYILIDWERLGHKDQSPEEHEMGHAFGLGHVGVPGAQIDDATNIMCSRGEKFGSGGRRNLGFTEAQTAIILYHAERTLARLKK